MIGVVETVGVAMKSIAASSFQWLPLVTATVVVCLALSRDVEGAASSSSAVGYDPDIEMDEDMGSHLEEDDEHSENNASRDDEILKGNRGRAIYDWVFCEW